MHLKTYYWKRKGVQFLYKNSFLGGGGVGKVLLCHNFLKTSSPQDVINDRSLGIDKTKSFS